jgi:ribosomal protein S13|tara:strand:- start:7 stop:180 length:174 start_codon:yes stop_codon:yes gene_type:complete
MKEKRILDVLLRSNINDMKDEELNELREIVNNEYERRQEERRELLESIRKGYISSYE